MSGVAERVAELHRQHYRRLAAPLIRILGSFEAAEDVVQEVFAQALQTWNDDSLPDQPLAWLHRAAKNRAIDRSRRHTRWQAMEPQLSAELETAFGTGEAGVDDTLRDDALRLVFTCCHPSLSPEAQIGLTLRTICGLTSEQVARAFLVKPTTLQQRLVRAQQKIDKAGIPYAIPERDQLPERLSTVLRTIYLVFNEGYGASDGDALVRHELCDEGIRLARLVVGLLPESAPAKGLLALTLLHHSRRLARTSHGELVTLDEQDRGLWDRALIEEALPLVDAGLSGGRVSTYAVEAAIAALHARAPSAADTDWPQIAALYALLVEASGGSPVVALNAAVALAMAGDVEEGLRRLDALEEDGRLARYHLLPAARADLLRRIGRTDEAIVAFEAALELVSNPIERRFIEHRIEQLSAS